VSKRVLVVLLSAVAAVIAVRGLGAWQGKPAAPGAAKPPGTTVRAATVVGEVVDLPCYLEEGRRGTDHAACAVGCLKGGAPAGLVDARGRLYLLCATRGKSAPDMVVDYAGKQARVKGTLLSRGGLTALMVDSVGPVGK